MTTLPLLRRSSVVYSLAYRSYHALQTSVRAGSSPVMRRGGDGNGKGDETNLNYFNTLTNMRSHASIITHHINTRPFSTRRRRRRDGGNSLPSSGSGSGSGSDGEASASSEEERETLVQASKPTAIIKDTAIFEEAARAFLNRTVTALEPMKAQNENMKLNRSYTEQGEKLIVSFQKASDGQYILQVDVDVGTLSLTSPMSGNHVYVLCAYTGQFLGMNDGHVCEGMIVRDMIRHCNGMPQF